MSTEERVVALMGAVAGVLLVVATPQLPRDAAIICWLCLVAAGIGYGAYKLRRHYRKRLMTDVVVLALASALGLMAGVAALYVFPKPEGATSEELELEYSAGSMTATELFEGTKRERDVIVLDPVRLVNRSDRNMSLEMRLMLQWTKEDGQPSALWCDGEWKDGYGDKPMLKRWICRESLPELAC